MFRGKLWQWPLDRRLYPHPFPHSQSIRCRGQNSQAAFPQVTEMWKTLRSKGSLWGTSFWMKLELFIFSIPVKENKKVRGREIVPWHLCVEENLPFQLVLKNTTNEVCGQWIKTNRLNVELLAYNYILIYYIQIYIHIHYICWKILSVFSSNIRKPPGVKEWAFL